MKYNYRAVDRPSPASPRHVRHHPSSNFFYYAEQPIPVGYSYSDFGHSREYFRNQLDAREAIRRQLEKERIREEIIAEEIAQRRILEAEVRMELMMEREAAMRRGDTYPPFGAFVMRSEPRLPPLRQQPEERSLEERIVRLLEERLGVEISGTGVAARGGNGRSQMVPFHERSMGSLELKPLSEQQNVESNILEVTPASECGKEKERIIFKAKPVANVSGGKRKAETSPEAMISGDLPTASVPKKEVKEEWSCALCQVSATSQDRLNEHLRGKKHKSKEAALKAQRNRKNFSIGIFPKKPKRVKLVDEMTDDARSKETSLRVCSMNGCPKGNDAPSVQINHIADDSKEANAVLVPNKGKTDDARSKETSLHVFSTNRCPKGNNTPSLQIDHIADESKEKNAALDQNKGKTKVNKKKKYNFWCEDCKIGAFSEKVMEEHKIGKKHLSRLRRMKCDATAAVVTQGDTATEKVTDDAEGTEENCKIGAFSEKVMEGQRMGKKHSSELQEMNCDSIAAVVTQADTATEKVNDNTEATDKDCKNTLANSRSSC